MGCPPPKRHVRSEAVKDQCAGVEAGVLSLRAREREGRRGGPDLRNAGRPMRPRSREAPASATRESKRPSPPFRARISPGPPPWRIGSGGLFGLTSSDDPARLYEDVLVAIDAERGINNGQPSLHAQSIDALGLKEGETVVQIGAGAGYYTAILADARRAEGQGDRL